MEKWSVACLGDSRMHAGASLLVQHKDVQAGNLNEQSGQQKNHHYGSIIDASKVAYKLPSIEGSMFSFSRLSSTDKGSTRSGLDRQHYGGVLYQPSGRYLSILASKACGAFIPLGGQKSSVDSSSTCPRQSKMQRGHAVQGWPSSRGVEAALQTIQLIWSLFRISERKRGWCF